MTDHQTSGVALMPPETLAKGWYPIAPPKLRHCGRRVTRRFRPAGCGRARTAHGRVPDCDMKRRFAEICHMRSCASGQTRAGRTNYPPIAVALARFRASRATAIMWVAALRARTLGGAPEARPQHCGISAELHDAGHIRPAHLAGHSRPVRQDADVDHGAGSCWRSPCTPSRRWYA
jgi:hypothetical protein